MTLEQANKILKLAFSIQISAFSYGRSEEESADHFENGIALIKAKKDLYQYLKENLDDTRTS